MQLEAETKNADYVIQWCDPQGQHTMHGVWGLSFTYMGSMSQQVMCSKLIKTGLTMQLER